MNTEELVKKYNDLVGVYNELQCSIGELWGAINETDRIEVISEFFSIDDSSGDNGELHRLRERMLEYTSGMNYVFNHIRDEWGRISRSW